MADKMFDETVLFQSRPEDDLAAKDILHAVYAALKEKGYNPINQLVGYLLSGDPAYITSHKNARSLIRRLERDDLLEELVRSYLEVNTQSGHNSSD
ncbi:MAG: IreB family regulatory phosphoprotein [Heliobacteriaceae bacterium]|nr:IreB family regulatory phosphoprotein [Heliobacteriaceae bacterium]MDD4587145.1 IreB family regulatory phosphoprotein [Heliobacteriaceae bacterium]